MLRNGLLILAILLSGTIFATDSFEAVSEFGVNAEINQLTITQRNIFVNNMGNANGNGSYAHPFNTLAQAQANSVAGDAIFVFAGDGTSKGMDEGIVLKDNQKLIGSGFPLITNKNGNGIELANNNEVSGVHIDSSDGWGIHGHTINKVTLTNNLITHPLHHGGIGIFNGVNRIDIENTTVQQGDDSESGILVKTQGNSIASVIIRNNIVTKFSEGIAIFALESSSINANVCFNDVSRSSHSAINIGAFDYSNSKAFINGNNIHDNSGNGIISYSGAETIPISSAILRSTIQNNKIKKSGQEGILVATGNRGQQRAIVLGNTTSNSGGAAGIVVETSKTGPKGDFMCLSLKNNHSDSGFFLQNFAGDTFNLEPLVANVGTVTTSGAITNVLQGSCN